MQRSNARPALTGTLTRRSNPPPTHTHGVFRVGVVRQRWQPVRPDQRCKLELFIHANHVRSNNEQRSGVSVTEELRQVCGRRARAHAPVVAIVSI